MPKHPVTVSEYLDIGCGRCPKGSTPDCKVHNWTTILKELRNTINKTDAVEEIKWHVPCYTYKGKNIFILSAFKDYVSIEFMKGKLFKDSQKKLIQRTENSQSSRYLKFETLEQAIESKQLLIDYIKEAIEIEDSGKKIVLKKLEDYEIPSELTLEFKKDNKFAEAFEKLTPGRKRSYLLHFNGAKHSETKVNRILKSKDNIFKGKGFNER